MSAEDFGHYLIAQLNHGSYEGVSVLSPAGISALHHPAIQMLGSKDFYAMGWEVQHFQDVEVIRHNGASPGYTTDMFLVPQENIAIAMVMNTYSPMLGIRVSRMPANVLRILLDQTLIPGNEFLNNQIIYAGVMLIPLLQVFVVVITFRRVRSWRRSAQPPSQIQAVRLIVLPLIGNALLAYILLVLLPIDFGADLPTILLFQPDVGWVALIGGIFAIVWGVMRTGIGISTIRQTGRRQAIV